jgi:hypothetical protein
MTRLGEIVGHVTGHVTGNISVIRVVFFVKWENWRVIAMAQEISRFYLRRDQPGFFGKRFPTYENLL